MSKLLSAGQLAIAIVPVNLATAANNGDWISLADYRRVLAIFAKAAGTAGEDPIFTLKQATSAAGAGAKDLLFSTLYKKQGADLTTIGTFDIVTRDPASATYVDDASAEVQAIYAVEIRAEQLDVDNGFCFVQLSIPKVGANAQLGVGLYLLSEPRYAQATPVSALA